MIDTPDKDSIACIRGIITGLPLAVSLWMVIFGIIEVAAKAVEFLENWD
jgi:hypothetical protein